MEEYQIKITATGIEEIESKLKKALEAASKSVTVKPSDTNINNQLKSFEQLEKQKSKYQLQAAKEAEKLAQHTANEQIKQAQRAYKETEKAAQQAAKSAQKAHQEMVKGLETGFNNLAKTGAVVFAGISILVGKVAKDAINAANEMDDLKDSIESMAKAGENVNLIFQGVASFSQNSPFSGQEIMAGVRALQEFGVTATNGLNILRDMGDAVSKLGIDFDSAAKIFGNIGAGRIRASSLAELGAAGITDQVKSAYASGGGANAQKVLLDFLKTQFAGGMADDMSDIAVIINKAQQKFKQNVLAPIGQSFQPFIKGMSDALQPILTPEFGRKLGTAVGHIVDAFGSKLIPVVEKLATWLGNLDEAKLESALKILTGVAGVAGTTAVAGGAYQAGKFLYGPFAPLLNGAVSGLGAALGIKAAQAKISLPSIGTFNQSTALEAMLAKAQPMRDAVRVIGGKDIIPGFMRVAPGYSQALVGDVAMNSAIGAADAAKLIANTTKFATALTKINIVINAILVIVEGVVENWDGIKSSLINLDKSISELVKSIGIDTESVFKSVAEGFKNLFGSIGWIFTQLGNLVATIVTAIPNALGGAFKVITAEINVLRDGKGFIGVIKAGIGAIKDSFISWLDNLRNIWSDYNGTGDIPKQQEEKFKQDLTNLRAQQHKFKGNVGPTRPGTSLSAGYAIDASGSMIPISSQTGSPTNPHAGYTYTDDIIAQYKEANPTTMQWPLPSNYTRITSTMNSKRSGGLHGGIDIAAPAGTTVSAIEPGKVLQIWNAGAKNGGGKMVFVQDDSGNVIAYTHVTGTLPKVGDIVQPGSTIGKVFKDHLDLKIMEEGVWNAWKSAGFAGGKTPWRLGTTIDPLEYLKDSNKGGVGAGKYQEALEKWQEQQAKDVKQKQDDQKQANEDLRQLNNDYYRAAEEARQKLADTLLAKNPQQAFNLGAGGILDSSAILTSFGIDPSDLMAVNAEQIQLDNSAQRLAMMSPVVEELRKKFTDLVGSIDNLKGAVDGLQDNMAQFNQSRAEAKGFKGEATAIGADAALDKYSRANKRYNEWLDAITTDKNGNPISNRSLIQAQDPFAIAQQATMVSGVYQAGSGAYGLAASLKGQEGYEGLASELLARTEGITSQYGVDNLGPQVLMTADEALNTSASLLDMAAADLSSAAGAISNMAANQQAQQQANQAQANLANGSPIVSGGNIAGTQNGKYNILAGLGNSQYDFAPKGGFGFNLGNLGTEGIAPATAINGVPIKPGVNWWEDNDIMNANGGCPSGNCGLLQDKYKGWKGPQPAGQQQKPDQGSAGAGGGGFDPMGWLMGGLNGAIQSWAGGSTPKQAIRSVVPNMATQLLSSLIPGPFGSLIGTFAGGWIGRMFGGKDKQLSPIKPMPVNIMNFDVLGAMLNVSRAGLLRAGSMGINAIATMRSQRAAVGI